MLLVTHCFGFGSCVSHFCVLRSWHRVFRCHWYWAGRSEGPGEGASRGCVVAGDASEAQAQGHKVGPGRLH